MHIPVMVKEVVSLMDVKAGIYIDGTLGGAGHAKAILEKGGSGVSLLGIDRDLNAVDAARLKLVEFGDRVMVAHGNFSDMDAIACENGIARVDGVLLDIGVSSDQLDTADRGFSLMNDGPLDMRMDRSCGESAADVVNNLDEVGLTGIFREFGEERRAGSVARAIVAQRRRARISTTLELAEIVSRAVGGRRSGTHPATRVFQALRIYVNGELESLREGLRSGLDLLKPGGRMAVITFHSLEDRVVKKFFASHAGRWESLQAGGSEWRGAEPQVELVVKKPVTPSDDEIADNPRARSAKLRVAQRL